MNPNDTAPLVVLAVIGFFCLMGWLAHVSAKRRLAATLNMPGGSKADLERIPLSQRLSRYDRLMANPGMNTRNWDLHQARMSQYGFSVFRGTQYHRGPRGGVYYINGNGRRTYC